MYRVGMCVGVCYMGGCVWSVYGCVVPCMDGWVCVDVLYGRVLRVEVCCMLCVRVCTHVGVCSVITMCDYVYDYVCDYCV